MLKRNKSGFTLVELIVVIVVLGILAAIGIPRYNSYVNDSRLAHIKADMKTISGLIEVTAMDDDGIYRGDFVDDLSELEKAISEGRAYKEGNPLLSEIDIGGSLHVIKNPFIRSNARSKLRGSFLVDKNDEVYYIADKRVKGNTSEDAGNKDEQEPGTWKFVNMEESKGLTIIGTLSNGVDTKYVIFDGREEYIFNSKNLSRHDEIPNADGANFTDGWLELPLENLSLEALEDKPVAYSPVAYSIGNSFYYHGIEHINHTIVGLTNRGSGVILKDNNKIYSLYYSWSNGLTKTEISYENMYSENIIDMIDDSTVFQSDRFVNLILINGELYILELNDDKINITEIELNGYNAVDLEKDVLTESIVVKANDSDDNIHYIHGSEEFPNNNVDVQNTKTSNQIKEEINNGIYTFNDSWTDVFIDVLPASQNPILLESFSKSSYDGRNVEKTVFAIIDGKLMFNSCTVFSPF